MRSATPHETSASPARGMRRERLRARRDRLGDVPHDAARPTLAVQNGPDGATYLMDAPIAGDPHYHLHDFIPNLVVTDDGRVGSID